MKAATELLRGFVENVYITRFYAAIRTLRRSDLACINYAEVDFAKDYVFDHASLWHETKGALAFLRWLLPVRPCCWNAAHSRLPEELTFADDPMQRLASLDRQAELVTRIDDASSKVLIAPRKDRHGKSIEPGPSGGESTIGFAIQASS